MMISPSLWLRSVGIRYASVSMLRRKYLSIAKRFMRLSGKKDRKMNINLDKSHSPNKRTLLATEAPPGHYLDTRHYQQSRLVTARTLLVRGLYLYYFLQRIDNR